MKETKKETSERVKKLYKLFIKTEKKLESGMTTVKEWEDYSEERTEAKKQWQELGWYYKNLSLDGCLKFIEMGQILKQWRYFT